jgi:hypothetical protein
VLNLRKSINHPNFWAICVWCLFQVCNDKWLWRDAIFFFNRKLPSLLLKYWWGQFLLSQSLESVEEAFVKLENLLQELHISSSNYGKEDLKAVCSDLEMIRRLKEEAKFLEASFWAKAEYLEVIIAGYFFKKLCTFLLSSILQIKIKGNHASRVCDLIILWM